MLICGSRSCSAVTSPYLSAVDTHICVNPRARPSSPIAAGFPPDSAWRGQGDAAEAFDSIGAGHAADEVSDDPMMHTTTTIDYLIVLRGEIWAILDEGEICLKQGDVMIQRGTKHSWSVRTDEPCLLAAVLVNAVPV